MRRRSRDGWAEPDPAGEERSLARAADAVERRLAEGIRPPRHHPRRIRGRRTVARGGARRRRRHSGRAGAPAAGGVLRRRTGDGRYPPRLRSDPGHARRGNHRRPACPDIEVGGGDGATGRLVVNPDGPGRTELRSKTVDFKLRRGDVISMSTQGGGAYGPVEARDPEAIARDLREEKISPEAARDAYGYQGAKG